MKIRKTFLLNLLVLSNYFGFCFAQTDTIKELQEENVKKNWTFGVSPILGYNPDVGFRYGAVDKLFNYGDGSTYPAYKDCIILQWSQTTEGSSTSEFVYDSERLIKKLRSTFEFNYTTDLALNFYGFNGYEANYNSSIEDKNSSLYLSELFYRLDRKFLRIRSDFQGKFSYDKLRWLLGFTYYNIKVDTVDLNKISSSQYPSVNGGLFGEYVQSGLIRENEIEGGTNSFLKLGLIYDTRDNEANAMHGIWSDIQFIVSPSFLGSNSGFARISVTHRQYFTLIPKKLSLAYRLSFQNRIAGTVPFYLLPFVHYLSPYTDKDGLGGSKTLRGILQNRVVGDGVAYGNVEFRWKFLNTILWRQNIYLALSAFMDGGMVTQKYNLQESGNNSVFINYITNDKEKLHLSAGAGFHFVLNNNFIISADYGKSFDARDGVDGIYVGLDFLY